MQYVTNVHLITLKLVLNHRYDGPLIRYEFSAPENDHMENELRIRRNELHSLSDFGGKIQRVKLLSIFLEEFQRIFQSTVTHCLNKIRRFDWSVICTLIFTLNPIYGVSKSKFFQLFLFFFYREMITHFSFHHSNLWYVRVYVGEESFPFCSCRSFKFRRN